MYFLYIISSFLLNELFCGLLCFKSLSNYSVGKINFILMSFHKNFFYSESFLEEWKEMKIVFQ